MRQAKRIGIALIIILAVGLAGSLPVAYAGSAAGSNAAPAASVQAQGKGPNQDDKGKGNDDKGKDDKGNNGKNGNGNNGNGNNGKNGNGNNGNANGNSAGNLGNGGSANANPPGRGLGAWWRAFRSRWFGSLAGEDFGGWQLGRFKDAFPFAYPPGWVVSERGDAVVLTGPWEGQDYLFQMTRTAQVDYDTLRDWVESDLDRQGLAEGRARYATAGRVEVAVVTGVDDPAYDCPVAYVYLWTQNPAGNNQRQALGVIAQEPGAACNATALNAFVDQYLTQIGAAQPVPPLVTPTAPATPAPSATQTPTATATPAATGWQQTRFFNAFSFAYPPGWTMDRLGDTAHLQGNYEGRSYVMDLVWVRTTPQGGLDAWTRADLADLGAAQGISIDILQQGGAQIAVARGVSLAGYACPVARIYVLADNPAGDGSRAFSGTLAQANGQACDSAALEALLYQMLRQA